MLINARAPVAGLIIVLRIFVPFAAAALLFAVTTMRELRLSLGALEIRLKNLFSAGCAQPRNIAFFSLGISLMLGFIPRFFEMWETANLACDARVCGRGPRRLLLLVPLVPERMMEAAADTALALEARGLGLS
jgi:biotin transport system permease protein